MRARKLRYTFPLLSRGLKHYAGYAGYINRREGTRVVSVLNVACERHISCAVDCVSWCFGGDVLWLLACDCDGTSSTVQVRRQLSVGTRRKVVTTVIVLRHACWVYLVVKIGRPPANPVVAVWALWGRKLALRSSREPDKNPHAHRRDHRTRKLFQNGRVSTQSWQISCKRQSCFQRSNLRRKYQGKAGHTLCIHSWPCSLFRLVHYPMNPLRYSVTGNSRCGHVARERGRMRVK